MTQVQLRIHKYLAMGQHWIDALIKNDGEQILSPPLAGADKSISTQAQTTIDDFTYLD